MTGSNDIVAGVFTIRDMDPEIAETIIQSMNEELSLLPPEEEVDSIAVEPPTVLDVRQIVVDDGTLGLASLAALALDAPSGPMWLVRGEFPLALIPIKNKRKDDPKKRVRSLVKWAQTFSPGAALGLLSVAYEDSGAEDEFDGIHCLVDLPLEGISVHRAVSIDTDEWLDDLTAAAEEELDKAGVACDVVLFDSSDDDQNSISGHVSVEADTDEEAEDLVRQAVLAAFSAFTPKGKVQANLSVTVEEECMYEMYADYLDGLEDSDNLLEPEENLK